MEEFITQNKQGVEKIVTIVTPELRKELLQCLSAIEDIALTSLGANIEINNKRSKQRRWIKGTL